ncbi:MAG: aldose 1-epimerase family protein [Nitrososphaerota archaeon]|nr:aldose 1-epimerase family protein [Candidatus Bathyarchaeota archaeon]MDW8048542.1 aldose 1-epimerase family protein [Nitrososphaerota archaeon]
MSRTSDGEYFSKTLIDVEKGIFTEDWRISSSDFGIPVDWSVEKKRLHGGLSEDVDVITVDNGRLSYVIVPTRGMSIWKGEYDGNFLGWASPVKDPVNPCFINLEARGGLGWLDGFNEWIVRCGLSSLGAPCIDTIIDNMGRRKDVALTLHGRIANIPASKVTVRIGLKPPYEILVEGTVYERTMFGPNLALKTSLSTAPGSNSLKIHDSIVNMRSIPDEMQILYHCNFGPPFLEEGARLIAPVKRVAPRDSISSQDAKPFNIFDSPKNGFVEKVYFMELLADKNDRTCVMLVNKSGDKAVSLSYSLTALPFFTLWKNTAALEDGYVVGLEPGTSFPNPKPFERQRKRVTELKPGAQYNIEITLSVHIGKEYTRKVAETVQDIAKDVKPEICEKPIPDLCPQ